MSEQLEVQSWSQRYLGEFKLFGLIVCLGVSIVFASLLHLLVAWHIEEVTPEVIASLLAFAALVWLMSLAVLVQAESLNEVAQMTCIGVTSGTVMMTVVFVLYQANNVLV